MYEPITESIVGLQEKAIPSIVVVDNPDVSISLLDLISKQKLGGFLYHLGDSFLDNQLDVVLDQKLDSRPWYASWWLESRVKSILEYHLKNSKDNYQKISEAFFYLLLDEYRKLDFKGLALQFVSNKWYQKQTFENDRAAKDLIIKEYPKIFNLAVPDLFFSLQLATPEKYKDTGKASKLISESSYLQSLSKTLYNGFLADVKKRPEGSMEDH